MNLLNESTLKARGNAKLKARGMTNFSASSEMTKEAREFSPAKTYDVFLSHRTSDAELVYGLKTSIESQGLTTFVYWIDNPKALTQPVTRETADKLRAHMRACRSLIYADTSAAAESRWMPWELGYIDGFRSKVAILPVAIGATSTAAYQGQEYLSLYPWIRESQSSNDKLSVIDRNASLGFLRDWISK